MGAGVTAWAFLTLASTFAGPQTYSDLKGQMIVTGEDVVDPPPGQPSDRVGLFLAEDSAKQIYDAMPAKPTNGDLCEPGLRLKTAGGLVCASHRDGSHDCSVAILLASGETKPIGAC
jgi:hypothetical protein